MAALPTYTIRSQTIVLDSAYFVGIVKMGVALEQQIEYKDQLLRHCETSRLIEKNRVQLLMRKQDIVIDNHDKEVKELKKQKQKSFIGGLLVGFPVALLLILLL